MLLLTNQEGEEEKHLRRRTLNIKFENVKKSKKMLRMLRIWKKEILKIVFRNECASLECKVIDYCLIENRFVLSNRLNISNIIIGEYLKKIWKIRIVSRFFSFFFL